MCAKRYSCSAAACIAPLPLGGYRLHASVSGGIRRARRLGCTSLCPLRRPREGGGPSLNGEARTASRCTDACSNAPFAPPGPVERPGDGPPPSRGRRIGRRVTVANMQGEAGRRRSVHAVGPQSGATGLCQASPASGGGASRRPFRQRPLVFIPESRSLRGTPASPGGTGWALLSGAGARFPGRSRSPHGPDPPSPLREDRCRKPSGPRRSPSPGRARAWPLSCSTRNNIPRTSAPRIPAGI